MNDITEDEIRKAITDALVLPNEGFLQGETSVPVEAKKHNISRTRMREILNDLCDRGILVRAKVAFTDGWGDTRRVAGYRLEGE